MEWTDDEQQHGKMVKLYKFPKDMRLRPFWVVVSGFAYDRTEYIVTKAIALSSVDDVQNESAIQLSKRWSLNGCKITRRDAARKGLK
jgi:hypothetical protein